jgi:hypothetical protein
LSYDELKFKRVMNEPCIIYPTLQTNNYPYSSGPGHLWLRMNWLVSRSSSFILDRKDGPSSSNPTYTFAKKKENSYVSSILQSISFVVGLRRISVLNSCRAGLYRAEHAVFPCRAVPCPKMIEGGTTRIRHAVSNVSCLNRVVFYSCCV